jgi:hypothetical protein
MFNTHNSIRILTCHFRHTLSTSKQCRNLILLWYNNIMNLQPMFLHICQLSKSTTTNFTNVRFFSCVCADMNDKRFPPTECFLTEITRIWSVVRMKCRMVHKTSPLSECPITNLTDIWFLSFVYAEVDVPILFS